MSRAVFATILSDCRQEHLAVVLLECDQVSLLVRAHLEREVPFRTGPIGDGDWASALRIPVVAAFAS